MFPTLLSLVQQQWHGERVAAARSAQRIAHAVLDGARDRSRDPHVRPLQDQQQRTDALHHVRKRPRPRKKARPAVTAPSPSRRRKRRRRLLPPRFLCGGDKVAA
jgi:hypothetical protein